MLINHIINGTKVVKNNHPLILIAFLFKLSFSFLFIIPLQNMLSNAFSHRPAATKLLAQWDLTPIIDFVFTHLKALESYVYIIPIGIIIAFTVHLFLNGGFLRTLILSTDEESEPFGIDRFFSRCGTYVLTFIKIALISFIFYLVIAILFIILSTLGMHLFLGESASEPVRFFTLTAQFVIFILLFLFVNMCMMYTKIAAVTKEPRSIYFILIESFQFLRKNIGQAIALYLLLLSGLLLISGIYLAFHRFVTVLPVTWSIIVLFLCQQATSFTRSWYRLVGFASQAHLYNLN